MRPYDIFSVSFPVASPQSAKQNIYLTIVENLFTLYQTPLLTTVKSTSNNFIMETQSFKRLSLTNSKNKVKR